MSDDLSPSSAQAIEKSHNALHSALHSAPHASLVLVFKRPLIGHGKQRLAATLGLEKTQMLAQQFLNCALEDLASWAGPVILAPAQEADRHWAETLINGAEQGAELKGAEVIPQGEGNLGQRIIDLDQRLRQMGHQRLVYIGSDAPALTRHHYRSVNALLQETDVVLSAAEDGGVTIMASGQPWPAGLSELPWSTESLGAALADCCQRQALRIFDMEPSYDIDIEADLVRLRKDLVGDTRPARQALYRLLKAYVCSPSVTDTPHYRSAVDAVFA